ncbi:hypothetical protein VTL71DRAFT_2630 [Oculimacula yallundae]|uniref:Ribosomal protein S12 n=1 Tax=Oculimacula yallundae TaxID=86028 RepID=A0ABR4CBI6_9HELO
MCSISRNIFPLHNRSLDRNEAKKGPTKDQQRKKAKAVFRTPSHPIPSLPYTSRVSMDIRRVPFPILHSPFQYQSSLSKRGPCIQSRRVLEALRKNKKQAECWVARQQVRKFVLSWFRSESGFKSCLSLILGDKIEAQDLPIRETHKVAWHRSNSITTPKKKQNKR